MSELLHPLGTWFDRPPALGLVACLPVIGLVGWLANRVRAARLRRFAAPAALPQLVTGPGTGSGAIRAGTACLAVLAVIIGVAGPRWGRDAEPTVGAGRDLAVVLDVSRSMSAGDVVPSRLGSARQFLDGLAHRLRSAGGFRSALVVVAARPELVCPLTPDLGHFRESLADLDEVLTHPALRPARPGNDADPPGPVSGTRLGAGLELAVTALLPLRPGRQSILLVSDGDDPRAEDQEWRTGVDAARRAKVPVDVIGIGDPADGALIPLGPDSFLTERDGTPVVSRLTEGPLRTIAAGSGGSYTPARTRHLPVDVWAAATLLARTVPELPDDAANDPGAGRASRSVWFFGLAFGLITAGMTWPLLGGGRRTPRPAGGRIALVLAGLLAPVLAGGGPPGASAPRPVVDPEECTRRGDDAYSNDRFADAVEWYTRAEDTTTDPGLVAGNKAAALFRLGDFPAAEQHYARSLEDASGPRRARLLYGLGTARLRRSGGTEPNALAAAIRAFEDCLDQTPDGPLEPGLANDARVNLELAKLLHLKAVAAAKPPPEGESAGPRTQSDPPTSHGQGEPPAGMTSKPGPQTAGDRPPAPTAGPEPTDEPPPGGAGGARRQDLSADLPPLSAAEANDILDGVVARLGRRHRPAPLSPAAARNPLDR